MNEQIVGKIKNVKSDVESAISQLNSVLSILKETMTVDGSAFQKTNINNTLSSLNNIVGDLKQEIKNATSSASSTSSNVTTNNVGGTSIKKTLTINKSDAFMVDWDNR